MTGAEGSGTTAVPFTVPFPAFSSECVDSFQPGFLNLLPSAEQVGQWEEEGDVGDGSGSATSVDHGNHWIESGMGNTDATGRTGGDRLKAAFLFIWP